MQVVQKARSFVKALVTRTLDFEFEKMPYSLKNISNARLMTLIRSELNCAKTVPQSPWDPEQIQIESSSACTLQCPLCPSGMGAVDRPHRNMTFDTYRSLIDEVGDHAIIAIMWMWGEPLINPKFPDMAAYAHSKNLATVTSTNGQHIQTREDAEALVASGLDNLIVALDGATQETYSKYRVGGDINSIFRCLELIHQAKVRLGSRTPGVNVRTVVMKHNEHELDDIAKIARRYNADMVSRKSAFIMDRSGEEAEASFAPDNPNHSLVRYDNGRKVRKSVNEYRCRRSWVRMSVTVDGTIIPCECDFNQTSAFGNGITDGSFLKVWREGESMKFRRQFLRDRTVYPFCADCVYRDSGTRHNTIEMKFV